MHYYYNQCGCVEMAYIILKQLQHSYCVARSRINVYVIQFHLSDLK